MDDVTYTLEFEKPLLELEKQLITLNQVSQELGRHVKTWEAFAVFHRAEVWVHGMKKPHSVKEAMRMKEWQETSMAKAKPSREQSTTRPCKSAFGA